MSLLVNELFSAKKKTEVFFLQSIMFVPHNGVFKMNFAPAYKEKRAATYR
jgi:hypothetical protein